MKVALALAMALPAVHVAHAQPAYDSGSYFYGRCTDVDKAYFNGFSTPIFGRTKQEALDTCFENFGTSVQAMSWNRIEGTFTCYFTDEQYNSFLEAGIPFLWFDNPGGEIVYGSSVNGGSEEGVITCYAFRLASTCSARVLAAVDTTFAAKYPKPAVEKAIESIRSAGFAAIKLPFNKDVKFGILELKRTSINWRVRLGSPAANVPGDLVEKFLDIDVGAGNRAYGTKFPPLFRGVADKLASADKPSFMLLFSDGHLLKPSNVDNYIALKAEMLNRLGATAPRIICIRIVEEENTPFLDAVCDSSYSVSQFPNADDYYDSRYNSEYDENRALANALVQEICP
ncbi:Hypothetical Protein FCC1311_051762 [Hondaea fermentalgiana]|uniref:VWFA domain-containing protein n=1 Tax=Hondaea fermentalgiana TaxID=2315210 RepID=A0A2R5GEG7_9STRA|nr:Hypothetical Protein FCC1311_051762 [Hondaea fermentalgiana]|eukprot:GBG28955.1 Hypothetical Protein FCC1311_051762 [Hondaea fermentalgiana]